MLQHRAVPLPDPAATLRLGETLGRTAQAGDIILLKGELGAGKTSLTQGIARGLGIADRITSPTFGLLHEYHEGRVPLYHFDLYRLEEADLTALGFPEYWERQDGLTVIEWAERLGEHAPPEHLEIRLEPSGYGRLAALQAHGERPRAWIDQVSHA